MKNPSNRFLLTISILLTFHSVTVFAMDPQEATNQITGDRLQDKNRLKATNQVTGCRLQVIGNNQSTENNQFTNSNSTSNQQLVPFLTMNPEEISEAENAFGFSERKTVPLKIPMETTIRPLSKLAYVDEVQGVDGAQKLSVQELLDGLSTDATKQFAAEVELGKTSTAIDFPIEGSSSSISSDKYSINPSVECANNILNLEKVADSTIRLSEQRNRCLVFAAAATAEGRANIAVSFNSAAEVAQEAIASYSQFAQKMKEGESTLAYQFRVKGLFLECNCIELEYRAKNNSVLNKKEGEVLFSVLLTQVDNAKRVLEEAVQARTNGQVEVATMLEEAVQYRFQAVKALSDSDITKENYFSTAYSDTISAATYFKEAAQARSNNQVEVAETYEQAAQYSRQAAQAASDQDITKENYFSTASFNAISVVTHLQRITQYKFQAAREEAEGNIEAAEAFQKAAQYRLQAVTDGDKMKVNNFLTAAYHAAIAVEPLKKAAQAVSEGQVEVSAAFNQSAQYHFQSAEAIVNGNNIEAENFSTAAFHADNEAKLLQKAAQSIKEGQVEVAKTEEQAAQCSLKAAQAAANKDRTKADDFAMASSHAAFATERLKEAVQMRSNNQVEVAEIYEKAAHYSLRATQAAVDGDRMKAKNFALASSYTISAAKRLKEAAQARGSNQVEVAEIYEKAARYSLKAAQATADEDYGNANSFLSFSANFYFSAKSFEKKCTH